jgi:RimJ/RimL family protein N-acetyltransferase
VGRCDREDTGTGATHATHASYSVRSPLPPRYAVVATEKVVNVADCMNARPRENGVRARLGCWDGPRLARVDVRTHRRPDGRVVVFPSAPWTPDQTRWAVQFARSMGVSVITHISADRAGELRILTDAGFAAARREVNVEVNLVEALAAIGDARLPPGVAAISAADADLDRLRLLDDGLRDDIPGTAGWRSTPEEFASDFSGRGFNPATYLVAIDERTGEYVGLVRIWLNRTGPRIGMFGVLPTHPRRGIALGLLARCLFAARELGHRTATSEYDETNKASEGLFERLGARQTGPHYGVRDRAPAA